MDAVAVEPVATPELDAPALVEGLPGVGLVGKLAADHLVEELDGQPVRRIYSEHFPPAVAVDDDGTAALASMTVYAVEAERDLLVLTGRSQAGDGVGQYRIAEAALDVAGAFGAEEVVTMGGSATGELVEDYAVVGAVAGGSGDLRRRLEDAGVSFRPDETPDHVVGMSGLLLGLGGRRSLPAASLLGTTSGYHVDPKSARVVLEALQGALGFSVDLGALDERAEQVEDLLERMQEVQQQAESPGGGEDLRYLG